MPNNTDWKNDRIEKIWLANEIHLKHMCNYKIGNRPQEVQEVLADTCLSLCIAINQNKDIKDERAWLFKTANNILNTRMKELCERRKREVSLYSQDNEMIYDVPYVIDFVEIMVKDENVTRKVGEIFSMLSETERQVFILFHIHHIPYKEIAEKYHMTEDAAKQLNYRTKRKVAEIIGKKAQELYAEV